MMKKWSRAMYQPNLPLEAGHSVTASKEHITLSKEAAKESMVLLKNSKKLLPLPIGTKAALFGKGSFDYVKGGGGSGDVTVSYVKNLYEGLQTMQTCVSLYEPLSVYYREAVRKQYEQGSLPGMLVEPILPDSLVHSARAFADTAIIAISRFSGEGWDRSGIEYNGEYNPWENETSMPKIAEKVFPDGDFYLTREEKEMIAAVEASFDKIIVCINAGGVIDTNWFRDNEKISSVLLTWQGGMEGGTAAAELICGKGTPSGKLTDTYASCIEDYPSTEHFHESVDYVDYTEDIYVGYRYFTTIPGQKEKICYPFGYGLSYTSFAICEEGCKEEQDHLRVQVRVTNTGRFSGKEVVQLYISAPQGVLGKPAICLGTFEKTRELLPGESQILTLRLEKAAMASFDDLGKIQKAACILEKGEYTILLGNSSMALTPLTHRIVYTETKIMQQLSSKNGPTSLKERMRSDGSLEALPQKEANDPNACILVKMKPGTEEALTPATRSRERRLLVEEYGKGIQPLEAVAQGKLTLDAFLAQLSDEDLMVLSGGQPNTGVANTFGIGNLVEYGIPNLMTADGPAGLRIAPECGIYTTAWPCATALAATWNPDLVEQVGRAGASEVKENNIAVWLTPAVNIHRNPLCGRNFEYYSEDPLLAGKMGAAMVRGIQSMHVAAAVKHFACNNKETNRKHSDSRVSERALREIYLKQFEIIVKESNPWIIMSSYNMINGHRASEDKELLEDILRSEWGFQGMVVTDWWTRGEHYKEILAGNDLKMACGFPERLREAMDKGALTRNDLLPCAKRILECILKID